MLDLHKSVNEDFGRVHLGREAKDGGGLGVQKTDDCRTPICVWLAADIPSVTNGGFRQVF